MTAVGGGKALLRAEGLGRPIEGRAAPGLALNEAGLALIRPESARLVSDGIPASVTERVYLGEITAVRLRLPNSQEIWCRRFAAEVPDTGKQVIGWDETAVSILPAEIQRKGVCCHADETRLLQTGAAGAVAGPAIFRTGTGVRAQGRPMTFCSWAAR